MIFIKHLLYARHSVSSIYSVPLNHLDMSLEQLPCCLISARHWEGNIRRVSYLSGSTIWLTLFNLMLICREFKNLGFKKIIIEKEKLIARRQMSRGFEDRPESAIRHAAPGLLILTRLGSAGGYT